MPNQPLDLDAIRDYPGPALLARCLDMIEALQEALENVLPLAKGYAAITDQVIAQAEAALAGSGKKKGRDAGDYSPGG